MSGYFLIDACDVFNIFNDTTHLQIEQILTFCTGGHKFSLTSSPIIVDHITDEM